MLLKKNVIFYRPNPEPLGYWLIRGLNFFIKILIKNFYKEIEFLFPHNFFLIFFFMIF